MTITEDVIRLAREAGFNLSEIPFDQYTVKGHLVNVERLISLAKAEEREACAELCDLREDLMGEHAERIRARTQEAT